MNIALYILTMFLMMQFTEKDVSDNIELVGKNASIDRVNDVFIVVIDGAVYKAPSLEQALNMVYQTKIRSYDDYMFTDQKWGLLIRVTVDDGGWTVDMGSEEKYHADTFLRSKEIVYELFAEMMKGRLIFNYTNEKYNR